MARGLMGRLVGGSTRSAASTGVPSYGLIPPLGSVQSSSGQLISQATAMAVSAVYRAVYVRAHDVARCKASLVAEQPDGTRGKVDNHPLARLLKRPNRVQTWYEFIRDLMVGYLLRGNGYAAALQNGASGDIDELILVNPDAVIMLEAWDGSWFYNVNRLGLFQLAMLRDLPVAIPSEYMLHVRGISFNMLVGASTIGLGRDSIGLAIGMQQQQSRWIANSARPSGVIKHPKVLQEDVAKRLKAQWNELQAGVQNTGKTAVLEEGMEWQQLGLSAVDLQFINQLQLTVQDVARLFGVPPRKLMQPDTSRGSTIIQEDQSYINETVAPDLEMIEQKMAQFFNLEEEGLALDLDESPLLRADPLTRYNIGRIGKLSGLISTNEWRRGERLPPAPTDPNVDPGDAIMSPVNLAALGSDTTGTAPDDAGRPKAGQGGAGKPGVPNEDDAPDG